MIEIESAHGHDMWIVGNTMVILVCIWYRYQRLNFSRLTWGEALGSVPLGAYIGLAVSLFVMRAGELHASYIETVCAIL